MSRTVILGYYGFANTGDEALLEAIAAALRRRRPDLEIAVLTAGRRGAAPVPGATAVDRWRPVAVARALRAADLLIAGGGTLLQDRTSLRSLAYYVGVILLARQMGRKVMLYANGLGPLGTDAGRWLARQALEAADAVTLRDRRSLADLQVLFPDLAGKARLTADPALCLTPDEGGPGEEAVPDLLASAGLAPGRRFVAACVRPWEGVPYEAPLAAALDAAAARHGLATVFLPMQVPRDVAASRRVMDRMRTEAHLLERVLAPRRFMAVLGRAQAVAAMRLHAAVLAAALHLPALGIAYDPKVEGVVADLGLPLVGRPGELTAARLEAALEDLIARREEHREALRQRVAALRPLAEESADLAVSLLPS